MLAEYKNILVPVDGSGQSEDSFKKAVAIAKRNNAALHLSLRQGHTQCSA